MEVLYILRVIFVVFPIKSILTFPNNYWAHSFVFLIYLLIYFIIIIKYARLKTIYILFHMYIFFFLQQGTLHGRSCSNG